MSVRVVLCLLAPSIVSSVFVKGCFHQHAAQPQRSCHYAAKGIDACGPGCLREQDDGGTAADTLLKAIVNSSRGYAFVGIAGNEEPAVPAKHDHGIVTLVVTENQMAAVCTKGEGKHCKHPCDPIVPEGAGPWKATNPPVNNLHREYIQGVPGVFVQHPTTDPQRDEILAYMTSGQDNIRGMEVFNSWVEQAWDAKVALDDKDIDPLYPPFMSLSMKFWDTTLRTLKRPVYGLADDDGFDYTGDSSETVYPHSKKDTAQQDTPSWFRFGVGYSMVDVADAKTFTAADISKAVDKGQFYASTGVELDYNVSGDVMTVVAKEPVVFGATGGGGEEEGATPLVGFNLTLCASTTYPGMVTNVGCAASSLPPPPAEQLVIDMTHLPSSAGAFFFVRVQASVRTRYPIVSAPKQTDRRAKRVGQQKGEHSWDFTVRAPQGKRHLDPFRGLLEGHMVRVAGGVKRRPFVVHSIRNMTISCISHFSDDDDGDITPETGVQGTTSIANIVPGANQLVAERWAWLQPVWKRKTRVGHKMGGYAGATRLEDPFAVTGDADADVEAPSGWTVSTVAGSGPSDIDNIKPCAVDPTMHADGAVNTSRFAAPTRAQVFDDVLYVMDGMNGCIRSIGPLSSANPLVGSATTCCEQDIGVGLNGDGPQDMHVTEEYFYILDSYHNQVKRAKRPFVKGTWELLAGNGSRPVNGQSTDGPALQQALNEPHGMAVASGNGLGAGGVPDIYIAETWSSCIRLLRDGQLTTVAGKCGIGGHADGAPADARFQHMHHVNLDPRDESHLYVSDVECYDDDRYPDDQKNRPCASTDGGVCFSGIRMVQLDRATGKGLKVSTVSGLATSPKAGKKTSKACNDYVDGSPKKAMYDYIHGTAFRPLDSQELELQAAGRALNGSSTIYVCDEDNNRIRSVDLLTRKSATLAGDGKAGQRDGPGLKAKFQYPGGIGLGPDGSIYVGDYEASRIRKVAPPGVQ